MKIIKIANITIAVVLIFVTLLFSIPKKIPSIFVQNDLSKILNHSFPSEINSINDSKDIRVEFDKEIVRYPNNKPELISKTKTLIIKSGSNENLKLFYRFSIFDKNGNITDTYYQRFFIENKKYYIFDSKTNNQKELDSISWKNEFVIKYSMGMPVDDLNLHKLPYSEFFMNNLKKISHHKFSYIAVANYYDYSLTIDYNMFSKNLNSYEIRESSYNGEYLSETTNLFYKFN